MATKVQIKTTYEPAKSIEPLYTGGDISSNASGTLVATCVEEDVLIVDIRTGKPLCRIEGDGEAVTSLTLSPTSSHLAICSRSLSLRLYALSIDEKASPASYELLRTLKPHTTPVVSSSIDSSGKLLATGGADGSVKVWDVRGGFATHNFHPHGGVVSALCFFNSQAQLDRSYKKSQKNETAVTSLLLASGGEDGKIKISNLDTSKIVATLDSHTSVIRALAYSEQDRLLLSASRDRTLILWSAQSWKQEKTMPALEVLETAGFLPGGKVCYSGGEHGNLKLWSTTKGLEVTPKQSSRLENEAIVATIVIKPSSTIVTVHRDQSMRFYSFAEVGTDKRTEPLKIAKTVSANLDEIIDLACVGPQLSMLALATNTESIRLISIDESKTSLQPFGNEIGILEGHKDIIICLDVDYSGHWLATGAKDNTARLWQIDPATSTYRCLAAFEGHAESLGAIALPRSAPSGGPAGADPLHHPPAFLLTGSQDKTVKRWDTSKLQISQDDKVSTGARALYTRVAHEKDINALDVSPTAPLFASASQDKTIKVWSLQDGSVTGILRGHKRGVWSVKFSPAGTPPLSLTEGGSSSSRGLLVSGSGDRSIKVWSLSTYTCLLTFEGHSNSVLKVIWLPPPSQKSDDIEQDPHTSRNLQNNKPIIASASADTLIKLWSPYASSDSDPLLTTLDNHTDRVWALATPSLQPNSTIVPYRLISGAADAMITFWRDTTTQTASIATKRATERVEQDQMLQNHIYAKNYREVITLSLALNHPGRLLRVFQDVISLPDSERETGSIMGVDAVDDVLASLDEQQVFSLLERVRDWNTNARFAPISQRVLNCLLKSYPASFFINMAQNRKLGSSGKGPKEVLRALEVYTDRHYKRMEELVDESYLLEYTLREMDEVMGAVGVNGVGIESAVNGDVIMT